MNQTDACALIDRLRLASFEELPSQCRFTMIQRWLDARKLRLIVEGSRDLDRWQSIENDHAVAMDRGIADQIRSNGHTPSFPNVFSDNYKKKITCAPRYDISRPILRQSAAQLLLSCALSLTTIENGTIANPMEAAKLPPYLKMTEHIVDGFLNSLQSTSYYGEATPEERDQILTLRVKLMLSASHLLAGSPGNHYWDYQQAVSELAAISAKLSRRLPKALRMAVDNGWTGNLDMDRMRQTYDF